MYHSTEPISNLAFHSDIVGNIRHYVHVRNKSQTMSDYFKYGFVTDRSIVFIYLCIYLLYTINKCINTDV